jgi:hypothetical protein
MKVLNIKVHGNPSGGNRPDASGETDGRTAGEQTDGRT